MQVPSHVEYERPSTLSAALMLLATWLATQQNARVLVLTFHHALCGDIRHLFEAVPEVDSEA